MSIFDVMKKLKVHRKRYSYLFTFLLFGILLMAFPTVNDKTSIEPSLEENTAQYSIEKEEQRLEQILSNIYGVGECKVLLSIHTGEERILAEDEGETVILSEGSKQATVTVQTRYPPFQGAVIVSGGCQDPSVRYDILSSVMAYTGLSVDRITICPIKE